MTLKTISVAPHFPVTLADAKLFCNLTSSWQDATVNTAIAAATEFVSERVSQTLVETTFRFDMAAWWFGVLAIPAAPVRDVAQVAYLDATLIEQVVDPANYDWYRTTEGANLCFISTFSHPTVTLDRPDAVRVTFAAGYDDPTAPGADPELLPLAKIKQAMLMLIKHWYDNRGMDTGSPEVRAAEALLAQARIYR